MEIIEKISPLISELALSLEAMPKELNIRIDIDIFLAGEADKNSKRGIKELRN